jgi:hypothetical protein
MPDLILDMCYTAIFDGLPVMLLNKYWDFMWDHDTNHIHDLAAFRNNFDTTAAIVQYLQALRDLIARNDSERIEEQIMELYMTHRREYSFFLKELRDWILGRLPLAPADSLHNRRPGPVFHRQEPDGLDPVHDKENIAPTGPPGQTTNLAILKLRGRLDNVLQSLAY